MASDDDLSRQIKLQERIDDAVVRNDVEGVKAAFAAGASISSIAGRMRSPLSRLVTYRRDSYDMIPLFLEYGADINEWIDWSVLQWSIYGQGTLLHYTACHGLLEASIALVKNGADINAQIKDGLIIVDQDKTPLCMAAENGWIEVVKTLLSLGADPVNAYSCVDDSDDLTRSDKIKLKRMIESAEKSLGR